MHLTANPAGDAQHLAAARRTTCRRCSTWTTRRPSAGSSRGGSSGVGTWCTSPERGGGEATCCSTSRPDALFIDVWLGTESGFELMSWIEDVRAHARRSRRLRHRRAGGFARARRAATLADARAPRAAEALRLRPARGARAASTWLRSGRPARNVSACPPRDPIDARRRARARRRTLPDAASRASTSAGTRRRPARRSRADSGASPPPTSPAATASSCCTTDRAPST